MEKEIKKRGGFLLYISNEIKKEMKLKEIETGKKYQDKIREFIKEDLKK